MSSSPTGWWRRGCFSSIGAGLNDEQTNIMSQPQAVYHLRWLKSMRGFQSSGVVTHLSKTSRLRASFVRVGVLSVFWRNSTFFFRLCRHTHTKDSQPCSSLLLKAKAHLVDSPYRNLFISSGQIVLQRLHFLLGLAHLHWGFVKLKGHLEHLI